jgi:tetratricopeptide (TPR) repeat protein
MSRSDDSFSTQPSALVDPLEAKVTVFRQQPEARGFAQLRQELRDAGRGELLAELCATWAQHERDPHRAADAWSEAGEAMAVLNETATAIEYLRTALELDPTNERAADRLLEIVEPYDPAAAAEIIETELTELAKRAGDRKRPEQIARRAAHHRRAAALWNEYLGRVDRALWHYQQAWKLEPQKTESLEAARNLYASLGDDGMVSKLYMAELEVLGSRGNEARKAHLRLELGKLALRQRDLEAAANHLEEASRLDPHSVEIAETLAEVYANPGFRGGQTRHKAGELFVELGRKRLSSRDDATGINYLRRAVGVDPAAKSSALALESALSESSQWDELDRILRHRSMVVTDPNERMEILRRRAALYRKQLPNRDALIEVLSELIAYEQPGSKATRELKELLRDDQQWDKLALLMEAEINALGADPNTSPDSLVDEILELATIAREHMGDRDRAAELLHQALGVDPTHEEALARYVDHFRERRDWRGLIDLMEFALDNVREAGADSDELVRRLEEIAQLAELRLGDIPRAIEAWQRIAELEPGSGKVNEALRRLGARSKMWEQLVQSLEQEVASAMDPVSRMQSLKKMAQTYRERQLEPRRAIELYEQVLSESLSEAKGLGGPDDDQTLKALVELYEKEGDDQGLANTLRRQLDLDLGRLNEQMRRSGKPADAPKEWPVNKRSERLTTLRRLAQIYETRLADVDGVVYACSAVLELLSGDRDALERMERVLEKANDPRLEQTLEYHAAASASPGERAKLLKRLAKFASAREDDVVALDRWEQTLRASPSDPDALAALAGLYERSQRWPELASVLERIDGGRPLPQPGSPEAALRALELERYAVVMDQHMKDPGRAVKAWHRVLELTPRNRNALDSLATLYRANAKWKELADILGRQIPIVQVDDPQRAGEIAMERAELLEAKLGSQQEAIRALELVLGDINPNHLEAHTALRRLHEARGDFESAVRIAEREIYLAPDPERKISRGLEIGYMSRDRLNNPTRALQAFKRVLELDPDQEDALASAADLLAKLGRWKEHVVMLERTLHRVPSRDVSDSPEHAQLRRSLVQRIAAATADKLGDPKGAFRWWRRAHEEAPDEQTLSDVRRAGEAYGLWRELAEVLTDERKRLLAAGGGTPADPNRFVMLSRELAALCERKLNEKPRAVTALTEAMNASPRDLNLLMDLERLAGELDQRPLWKSVLEAFDIVIDAATPAERVDLYLRRARILEDRTNDAKGAVAEVLAAFSWGPDRDDIRAMLEQLAPKARAWNELISVDSALIERAATTEKRVALLRRKAQLIEEQLKDAPRAFRTHLVSLLLSPEDADTTSHLWRLARVIGKYRETDKTPKPEVQPAWIQHEQAVAEAIANANRANQSGAQRRPSHHRLGTQPIDDTDLTNLHVGDSTQPLDLAEVEMAASGMQQMADSIKRGDKASASKPGPAGEFAQENTTMQLSNEEVTRMTLPPRPPVPAKASSPGLAPGTPGSKLPPPPPRPPQIAPGAAARMRRPSGPPPLPGMGTPPLPGVAAPPPLPAGSGPTRKPQAPVRRPPLPALPSRAFETPWEELAVAYESLPAPDATSRLRWLYRAAEVWETGGKDIGRAFDALARAFAQARRTPQGDADVRARLHRMAQEHKAWDRLADLYEGMAEDAETAVGAADLLMEVATIRYEQKRPREAEAQLRRILGMMPNDATARGRLEELYRNESRWVELAASLEERTDPRLGTAAPEAERGHLLRELAAIYTEQLRRPHDAIDAFEKLRVLAPTDITILQQIANLLGSIGRWSKVIETLTRINELAEGTEDARYALHSIAHIYVKELELPERALEALVSIVTTWPDDLEAWAQLDDLYQAQGRWAELADVLRRRAGLSRDPVERSQLLARRAAVLMDRLNAPEEAAATLKHARTVAPEDPALADQMVHALTKAGQPREAAAILENRIATLAAELAQAEKDAPPEPAKPSRSTSPARAQAGRAAAKSQPAMPPPAPKGPSRGDLAVLYIRLAQLRNSEADKAGARDAIEHALALVPEHPTALAVLAELSSADEDPRAFADAKLREAESVKDEDVKIAALMAAGEVLHTRVGDIAAAHAAYSRVLQLRPYHADATWALAGLSEQGGDAEAAQQILERKLHDESLTPPEKARILTQLAALSRAAGVDPAAERCLLEALGTVPDHIPAIVALADFYADAERWNDLEAFLREILDGSTLGTAAPGALIADLHRRLATAQEKLGRDEDAYQTLTTADRMHRGHLLVKLALGENRYKARRWRESALHLSPLANHEDAAKYPSEVAQGLYHAALAEIRSLRPEKAPALYERALELKPNYGPALHALAEIATEQGDPVRAADLLTRQATGTEDPGERLKLFEALGDMSIGMMHDEERARSCYAAAVGSAQPLEAKHVPLLEKLLDLQNRGGDLAGSARTAELMAAFGATPADRAARHLRAAYDYLAVGDKARASAAANRAVEMDPYDVDAVDFASQIALEHGDVDSAAAMLTRLLTAKDDRVTSTQGAHRALLSYRLGAARAQRGDTRQAIPALEHAVQLAPESEGATAARRTLVELAKQDNDPSRRDALAAHLAAIAQATGALADLVAWGDEMRRQSKVDAARATLELAVSCGHPPDVHQKSFLQINKPYQMRDDEPYKGTLDDHSLLVSEEHPLAPIASTLAEAAALMWPDLEEALTRQGCAGAKRIPPTSKAPAVGMFPKLTNALGTGAIMLYFTDTQQDVTVVAAATPVIVLGRRLATEATPPPLDETRALIARAVELTRPEHIAFAGLPPRDATRLLTSIVRLFGPPALREAVSAFVDEDMQRGHDEFVKGALPIKLRTRLEQLLSAMPATALDNAKYVAVCERNADRAALLLGGDPRAIVALARARNDGFEHLIRAVAQPNWLPTRQRLGVGIR